MKTVLRVLAVAGLIFASQRSDVCMAAAGNPLIARTHFIGSDQLFADPGGKKLKELWTLPGSVAFRNEALDRFAQLPAQYFGVKGAAKDAALVRPLLEDLLAQESYVDFSATPELVIAAKLPEARVKAWDANLRQAVSNWKFAKPTAVNAEGFTGWEVKRSQAPQVLRFGRVGEWTVLTAGPEKLALSTQLIGSIRAQGRPAKPSGAWLDGDLNLSRVRGWLPILTGFENLPMAHFSFSNRADFVRTLVTLDFPKAHNWKPEPWRIPTNSIFDPLISFVAVRGIAPVLDSMPEIKQVGWSPTPNQITGWAMRQLPFQFTYVAPTRDVTNQLKRAAPAVRSIIQKGHTNWIGGLVQDTNNGSLRWSGLPLATPRLGPLRNQSDFVSFEMFPLAATKAPAPHELFQQISRDNLVLYDWEITEERIPSWRQFYQIAEIMTRRTLSSTNLPSARWVSGMMPKLGEAVTEVTVTSPTQMTLVRKSHLGLNAFEMITLGRWVESTNFPAFGAFLPQGPRPLHPPPAR